ncbi:BspA family leucine-rich repeat surface protein [Flagellimonas allohymeniacidonis]|uniref:BspA family leucine-rich repeat surface protein n=1 Tax=Flagellimonas allohymeniacidonis TaxID=2517819 RepID=A0A4Q8QJY7_9FLAO|nr:BspA family leucine-rich repeat surface protein [Allomuricauda hymeniacidonis]TAI49073.1 BspA family leucine-rich repeat surface protein [Allomuricauda hymeniacidonis]
MKLRDLLLFASFAILVFACSKDDEKPNTPPKMADQAFTVAENIPDSQIIGTLQATDADGDALTFEITTNNNKLFEITEAGALSLASGKSLDFNTAQSHQITVSVSDGEDEATAKVTITVTNVNSSAMIEDQSFSVVENIEDTFEIGTVVANDEDGDELVFSITTNDNDLFEITEAGVLSLAEGENLDFETADAHTITVEVNDGTATAAAEITINVTNDNDNAPEIENQQFIVTEDIDDAEEIGIVVASDQDGDELTYSIVTNDADLFEITQTGMLSLAEGQNLDFEIAESHAITVAVNDSTETITAEITITVTNVNDNAPEMEDQAFVAAENIEDITVIGMVVAMDLDSDELVFSISTNDGNLFEITDSGEISLGQGQQLDYKTKTAHEIIVSVTDGTEIAEAHVSITVLDAFKSFADDPEWFVTTWRTDENGETITIFTHIERTYNYTIDWGDGFIEDITESNDIHHTYNTLGTYKVAIKGQFPAFGMGMGNAPNTALKSIDQWGFIEWETMEYAFARCEQVVSNAVDAPNLSSVTDLSKMFWYSFNFNGDLNNWNVSNITKMESMFQKAEKFNGNISGWDVSKVENMNSMFSGARVFNRDISTWQVNNVTSMAYMFTEAESFNSDIKDWDTSKVNNMNRMLFKASSFDKSLGDWDISNSSNLSNMLSDSGLSQENYSATLVGWASLESPPQGITLGADGLTYCDEGIAARDSLVNDDSWQIVGDSQCN